MKFCPAAVLVLSAFHALAQSATSAAPTAPSGSPPVSGSAPPSVSGSGTAVATPSAATGGNGTVNGTVPSVNSSNPNALMDLALSFLSRSCGKAVKAALNQTTETGQCLHTGLVWAAASNSNASLVPELDGYLDASCAAGCSNSTVTEFAQTALEACQEDITKYGWTNESVTNVLEQYPLIREIACLKTSEPFNGTIPGIPSSVTTLPLPGNTGNASAPIGSATTLPASASASAPSAPAASQPPAAAESSAAPVRRQEASPSDSVAPSAPNPDGTVAPSGSLPPTGSATGGEAIPTTSSNATSPSSNGTTPSTNSTSNGTYCISKIAAELETYMGTNLTFPYVLTLALSGNKTATTKLTQIPPEALCQDCIYAAYELVLVSPFAETVNSWNLGGNGTIVTGTNATSTPGANSAPVPATTLAARVAPLNGTNTTSSTNSSGSNATTITFPSLFNATCGYTPSGNGTLPEAVWPTAGNSTFAFNITFINATTNQTETKSPNATFPIPIWSNDTANGSVEDTGPLPAPGSTDPSASSPVPSASAEPSDAGAAEGAEPSGAEPSGEPSGAEPSDAEPSGAEPSGAEPSGAEPASEPAPESAPSEPASADSPPAVKRAYNQL